MGKNAGNVGGALGALRGIENYAITGEEWTVASGRVLCRQCATKGWEGSFQVTVVGLVSLDLTYISR